MIFRNFVLFAGLGLLGLFSCNPDCDSLIGLKISSDSNPEGFEVQISASPPSSLKGRRVFFNDTEVETVFQEDMGLIVSVPPGLPENVELRIEDPDCVDFVSFNFQVTDEADFKNNVDFIFPPIPEIIIPSLPLPADFPPIIENAWINPYDTDYCLWFGPFQTYEHLDAQGNVTIEDSTFIVAAGSFELSSCGNTDAFYHGNPFFGIVDYKTGDISVTIDRTAKGLGTEDFTGQFIDMEKSPYNQPTAEICGNTAHKTGHMILLTSKKNGRQLLVFQPM